jgi:hypothetical protein
MVRRKSHLIVQHDPSVVPPYLDLRTVHTSLKPSGVDGKTS